MPIVHSFGQCIRDAGAHPDHGGFLYAKLHGDSVGDLPTSLLIPRQLPASPMLVLSRVEHVLDVSVQGSHYADPREHCRAVMFCDQQQHLHRGLPWFGVVCPKHRQVVA
jgi:hypothetical protein